MKKRTYSNTDIQRKAHVKKSLINNLVDRGVVEPYRDIRGRGKRREFSHLDLLRILVCRELYVFGIPPKVMPGILNYLEQKSAWQRIQEEPEVRFYLTIRAIRSLDAKSKTYKSAMAVPKLVPTTEIEDLVWLISDSVSTFIIDLTALAKSVDT